MTATLNTTFDPAAIEARWYNHWEQNGLFRPDRPDAQPFTIVNPPPNVTGSLHIGHALDNTLQDIVIRYERLRGKDALWVVGTDHAGIATQMVVERQMEAAGDKRTNYSREEFIAKVWEWKHESGGTITGQLRRLGCSMDWSREQFTMDPHFTKAVVKVFVDMYNKDLIYRDKRLVNWDPKLKTAISDLEVETREMKGSFWHFKYPLADGVKLADGRDYIEVATTRPETMLADMAVAVHPTDTRYQSVIGKFVELPITGRRIPIVADEHADPELGSGAVKITPGHDFNDFDVGKRAGFKPADMLNMFDVEAKVVQTTDGLIPEKYLSMDRFDARTAVVEELKSLTCLIPHITKNKDGEEEAHDAEPRTIATPYGDRGGVVIEPWLTDQWYVDAHTLAQPPMQAVRDGRIEIVPKTWEKTFFNWMENIQPWCVSRQLWWGHQIPAWYSTLYKRSGNDRIECGTPGVYVAETLDAATELARADAGGRRINAFASQEKADEAWSSGEPNSFWGADDGEEEAFTLIRDPDVLDTWFSSALWPFATLGWPDDTALLKKHYPNDLLISGFDILFFWDARMAMQGMELMDEAPWKRLYLHGLVRAPDGQKMSKSKGNVVDPLILIDQYGADALRFFMAAMESQGRDIKMDEKRVEGYRNFATKLWNATRFCQTNGIGASGTLAAPAATSAVNKWIIGEVVETVAALDKAMADLRFDAAANIIYHFVWDNFCDWYIELVKGNFDEETKLVAGWVLDQILVMLHPFMPFITEELWHAQADFQGSTRKYELILAKWPAPRAAVDAAAKAEVEWAIDLIRSIRSARTELNVPPSAKPHMHVFKLSDEKRSLLDTIGSLVGKLAKVHISFDIPAGTFPGQNTPDSVDERIHSRWAKKGSILIEKPEFSAAIPLEGIIDIAAQKARLEKAMAASEKEAQSLSKRLDNPKFVEKAKPEAVEKARADHAHHTAEAERLAAALARLG